MALLMASFFLRWQSWEVIYLGADVPLDYLDATLRSTAPRLVLSVAQTLPGHELIAVELRGTGHSEPNLSCPEVDAFSGRARAVPIDDVAMREAFIDGHVVLPGVGRALPGQIRDRAHDQ